MIEPFPDGAVARYGPNQAIFSADLNVESVFDIQAADGKRMRGGIGAIQLSDLASGKSITVGTVKQSVKGQLLPPNRIGYFDAFDGIQGDVLLVWKHNLFSHDVVLMEQPELPADWNPANVRLEVLTEFFVDAQPELRTQVVRAEGQAELEDDAVIHFGSLAMVMGKAFGTAEDSELALGGLNDDPESIPVLKQWQRTEDGRSYLVESVRWLDIWPLLKDLPVAQRTARPLDAEASVQSQIANLKSQIRSPLQVAALDYQPRGCVLDFVIIPDHGTPTTLLAGTTYYIKTSYYSGSSVTFQPGCIIKFKNNANMLLYGPVSFPSSGVSPVFTSRNDNNFGQVIQGVPGEANSNGDPSLHKASKALWIYYVTFNTTVQNARFRWAQRGIQYDQNYGVTATHTVLNSLFEYTTTGLYVNIPSGSGVMLSYVKKCGVTTAVSGGAYSGSMTEDCGVVSVATVNEPDDDKMDGDPLGDPHKNSQSECSFVVVNSSRIVAAFFDTHLSEYSLGYISFPGIVSPRSIGWSVSVNGGASFSDKGALPPTVPSTTQGDAGDPVMARDTANGHIYLLGNPSREPATWGGFRLWKSSNNGDTFTLVNTSVPSSVTGADKPMIAVNNFSGLPTTGHIYVAGTGILGGTYGVFVTRSTNGGTTWVDAISLGANTHGADIAICPNGTVYVFYLAYTFSPPDHYTIRLTYRWLPTGQGISWQGPKVIWAHANSETLYSTKGNGSGDLLRHKNANPDDFFVSNALPRVAVNPANGHIYVVYADLPYAGSSTDRGDIFAREGEPEANGELKWTGAARKINNDGTATDQWNPSIAVNPSGTQVFIGYYSRHGDAANNAWIRAYGAKAKLATGLASATFDVFPVGTSSFTNLFNGTTTSSPPTSPWLYDHVWVQDLVCFDEDARVVNCGSEVFWGPLAVGQGYSHFCADDYSWLSADSTYFYFAWRDCSDTCNVTWDQVNYSRADANVRFAKIRQ